MTARTSVALLVALAPTGCWKEEYAELPLQTVAFAPEAGPVEEGWVVEPVLLPGLLCPDGETARMHMVYPEAAASDPNSSTGTGGTGGPPGGFPAAVLYPSGSFDFVFAPDPGDAFAGAHFAEPERLSVDWATRHAFTTLGMYPNLDELDTHAGAMALALVEEGIVVLVPGNCWGDLWHNAPGLANNDFDQDFFFRNGRTSADWGYRLLADPTFAPLFNISVPIAIDPLQTYAIGLGSGGRAVAEMLSLTNTDGTPTFSPAGVLVDSSYDDLRFYYDDPTLFDTTVAGLERIHPTGVDETLSGSIFASTNLPERTGYLFSTVHPTLPVDTFLASADRLQSDGAWLFVDNTPDTTLLNGADDLERARLAVQYLTTGIVPPPGPGVLPVGD